MAKQVQIRRGPLSNLITLVEGELGFVTDTKELVVGASGGNQFMAKKTHQHVKADITDFAHQHVKADIVDFPSSMPASDVQPWAKQASKPTYAYSEITNKPSLGTVSPINLPNDSTKYMNGMGDWVNTPTALGNKDAILTLFKGTVTIDATTRERYITLPLNELKNCTIILTWSSVDFGHSNVATTITVSSSGQGNVYYNDGQAGYVDFIFVFQEDSLYFFAYFQDEGIYQDYTINKIQLYLNK